ARCTEVWLKEDRLKAMNRLHSYKGG
ncbi:aminoacyl-tRNA hydrolase, partial [Erwinia amylovora]|nr:aminoacyl-tRNA hydrolase [Erwinia amylovora]